MTTLLDLPNTLRNNKLSSTINTVVELIESGEAIKIRNAGEFAVSVADVVEGVKTQLKSVGIKVFQANHLDYEPVYLPENELTPLAKPKIHHYRIVFTVTLSSTPIEGIEQGDTQQITEPKVKKRVMASPEI